MACAPQGQQRRIPCSTSRKGVMKMSADGRPSGIWCAPPGPMSGLRGGGCKDRSDWPVGSTFGEPCSAGVRLSRGRIKAQGPAVRNRRDAASFRVSRTPAQVFSQPAIGRSRTTRAPRIDRPGDRACGSRPALASAIFGAPAASSSARPQRHLRRRRLSAVASPPSTPAPGRRARVPRRHPDPRRDDDGSDQPRGAGSPAVDADRHLARRFDAR